MWPCPARPPAVERIEGAARERGETIAGLCRVEFLSLVEGEGAAEASPEELAFDVRTALAKDPARRGMDELAMRTLAERIAEHLAQARLRFTRKAPAPLRSTGSVGAAELLRRAVEPVGRTKAGMEWAARLLDAWTRMNALLAKADLVTWEVWACAIIAVAAKVWLGGQRTMSAVRWVCSLGERRRQKKYAAEKQRGERRDRYNAALRLLIAHGQGRGPGGESLCIGALHEIEDLTKADPEQFNERSRRLVQRLLAERQDTTPVVARFSLDRTGIGRCWEADRALTFESELRRLAEE